VASSAHLYGLAYQSAFNKEIDFDSDSVKALLASSSYTPNMDTHRYVTAIKRTVSDGATTNTSTTVTSATAAFTSADVGAKITGTGIPAAATIASVTNATTVVISAAATATATGVSLTFSHEVVGTGYTAGGQALTSRTFSYDAPTHTLTLDSADPSWTSSSIVARYLVYYVDTGTLATSALIAYADFGADQSSVSGTFTYLTPASGLAQHIAS
jgi:hypothetical protein